MKIGFFDSGIGGISVLYHALKSLPQEEFLYYADGDHVPFGGKTREEICSYTYDGLKFLFDHGVDVAVVACNTA
ncbi:MAG: glutamate racemase, partial [Clostridiales bacterium]|nr:glutamate racemase [Clostridiales bacterium]